MSASPDDTSFLQSLLGPNGSVNQNMYNPLMGLAIGLLQAGGPSRMPVSLGQALGQGLQTGQQFQGQGLQNAMQQLQLGRQMQLNKMLQNPDPTNPNWMANYALASGNPEQASSIYAQTGDRPMSDAEITKFYGKKIPGMTYTYNDYTHKPNQSGEGLYKDVTWQSPIDGSIVHGRMDQSTGQVTPFNLPGNGPQKPQPGDEVLDTPDGQVVIPAGYKSLVHKIASYDAKMPAATSRNPVLAKNLSTWVAAINPDWGQGQYEAKNAVLKSASGGSDAKKLDAFNTIQSHLASLQQAWGALKNGDVKSANKFMNWAGVQLGKDAPSNANIVNTLVGRELAAVLASGGQVTDADKKEANVINTMLSNGQQEGAIENIKNLIGGKTNSVVTRFKASHLSDNDIKARFTPDAWSAYQNFAQNQPGQQPVNVPANGSGNDPLGIR